ncbi:MAG: ribbon-helix-helix protein, CopG family [Magnetococcales bacterium]|nr:ribbon-helix-helix protein, CopG family [Magnetococcales bacterium]
MAHLSETKKLTVHVPIPLAEKIDQLAAGLERSRGWIVKQALTDWIDQEDEQDRLTRKALADVDSGHVIDHQIVQSWGGVPPTKYGQLFAEMERCRALTPGQLSQPSEELVRVIRDNQ